MKYKLRKRWERRGRSHPARGAWIEIGVSASGTIRKPCRTPQGVRGLKSNNNTHRTSSKRRTPQGVRGLKCQARQTLLFSCRRTPQGVRGLKFFAHGIKCLGSLSHPARGAWIEIWHPNLFRRPYPRRTPQGVRGLKLDRRTRRLPRASVAPRKGCVD